MEYSPNISIFVENFIYEHMAVEIVKMSGEELKRIWESSGLTNEDIQPRLKISPASYYNYIKLPEVPDKVEAQIDKDPELARLKNREISRKEDPPVRAGELVKFMTDTFELMKGQAASMGKAVETLSDDNKLLRKLVEAGLDAGALRWEKRAS